MTDMTAAEKRALKAEKKAAKAALKAEKKAAKEAAKAALPKPPRLVSLDALRGFDIFLLVFFDQVIHVWYSGPGQRFTDETGIWEKLWSHCPFVGDVGALAEKSRAICSFLYNQCHHRGWNEGFAMLDELMPLFLFMAGAAIPFAFARYLTGEKRRNCALWLRIIRRVVVLWIFGMIVQGNLLTLNPASFKLFSNTLQSIAVGYFFSALAYLYLPRKACYALFPALLAAFWAGNQFLTFYGCGAGSYEPHTNIAYPIDKFLLGRFRDGAKLLEDGTVEFYGWYNYTWIYSSLTFVATSLSGMLGGDLLYRTRDKLAAIPEEDKSARRRVELRAFAALLIAGVVCVLLARLWNAVPEGSVFYCPIIKYIWTPSMVLLSSGIALLLLAVFYLIFDVCKIRFCRTFLVVWGTNAIAAYMLSHIIRYGEVASWFCYGLGRFVGDWMNTINAFVGAMLLWWFLWDCWKRGKFLRV